MTPKNHLYESAVEWLNDALAHVDGEVLLTSPYLSPEVCKRLAAAAASSSVRWTLATTLDPSAVANGFLSVRGLRLLLDAGVEVRHIERLHAKCFVVGSRAMLGSANLTGAGLGTAASQNRELGVELAPENVDQARTAIDTWPSSAVDHEDLNALLAASRELTKPDSTPPDDVLDSMSALHLAERLLADARDTDRSLWLKLEYGEPALDGWRQESWFASPKKGRPGFRAGDFVVICAKDTHDCYAVVEVTADPEFQPQSYIDAMEDKTEALNRWPWINRTTSRLVPNQLMELKLTELGVSGQALQNGHVRLGFDQFTMGVRALARLASD
ncbi:phospholipase D-like domain-containing protein [Brachybacterium tyrofermentans]|uniref:phospholipase D-like domain-containing protein n=1 Tax=Brachybacterium tyrofermentans TaxID=47848 RepID=UPI003FD3DCDE